MSSITSKFALVAVLAGLTLPAMAQDNQTAAAGNSTKQTAPVAVSQPQTQGSKSVASTPLPASKQTPVTASKPVTTTTTSSVKTDAAKPDQGKSDKLKTSSQQTPATSSTKIN